MHTSCMHTSSMQHRSCSPRHLHNIKWQRNFENLIFIKSLYNDKFTHTHTKRMLNNIARHSIEAADIYVNLHACRAYIVD